MIRFLLKLVANILWVIIPLAVIFYFISWYGFTAERKNAEFGVTFSTVMARQLGLDTKETFDEILDDLGVKLLRIPVYWNEIEPERGKFIFEDYDYFIQRSEEKGAKVILALGRKLPRWPECFIPEWSRGLPKEDFEDAVLNQIRTVAERYKNSSAIEAWQIENEPFHKYGSGCAAERLERENVEREVKLVKSLDSRPVIITDSGESGWWIYAAREGDILGSTMYPQVWNGVLKVVRFPFGPGFYVLKHRLLEYFIGPKRLMVVELQAEPWGPGLLPGYSVDFQKKLMNPGRFQKTISYARRAGFEENILWGAEWWFWLKEKQKDSSLWDEAKKIFES